MSTYVFVFRGSTDPDAVADPARVAEEEAAWGAWFTELGSSVVDMGQRVGSSTSVGSTDASGPLGGYVLVTAASLDAAADLARGCPGLRTGGAVEIGEAIAM